MALVVAGVCALSLALLVGTTAIGKGTADLVKAFLFFIGSVAVLAALLATDASPMSGGSWRAWLQPCPIAALYLAIFPAFCVPTNALSLLEPRPAVETEPGVIENTVRDKKTCGGAFDEVSLADASSSPCAVKPRENTNSNALIISPAYRTFLTCSERPQWMEIGHWLSHGAAIVQLGGAFEWCGYPTEGRLRLAQARPYRLPLSALGRVRCPGPQPSAA